MKPSIAGAVTALIVSAVAVLIEIFALSPRGVPLSIHPDLALMFPIMLCAFVFGVACILLAPPLTRRIADTVATFCLAYILAGVPGLIATGGVRRYAFARLADRSQGLVTAIHAFEVDHRRPPSSLSRLVPAYLPAVPRTAIGAYPHYHYEAGDDGDWRLWVPASAGPMDFELFEYDPHRREWRSVSD